MNAPIIEIGHFSILAVEYEIGNSLEFSLFNANGDFISIYNHETNI